MPQMNHNAGGGGGGKPRRSFRNKRLAGTPFPSNRHVDSNGNSHGGGGRQLNNVHHNNRSRLSERGVIL